LEQRGLEGNGWSSAWKTACWARLAEPAKALENFNYCVHNYTLPSLFSICSKAMQVDGSFGVAAAIAEMLLQSHEGELHFLPALPEAWGEGAVEGLCARGGFEVSFSWKGGRLRQATLLSKSGHKCRVRADRTLALSSEGTKPITLRPIKGVVEFSTHPGATYALTIQQ
jgi:alpha-L-fucosidase 2